MSTEHHNHGQTNGGRPQHADVSFEATDVRSSPIFKFLIYMGITVILSFFLSLGIYRGLKSYWNNSYETPAPMRGVDPYFPPEPRMQGMPGHLTDPQLDMRTKVESDNKANNELGWADKNAGIAQIPVKDAMKIIVEKGLPAISAPAEKK
ncbi:MAG TPA: hypothetical protein VFI45_05005 [Candidatus Acidoferrum sp.]|nr:hypothetical protein [Candidatus Acidoferrum sp.]